MRDDEDFGITSCYYSSLCRPVVTLHEIASFLLSCVLVRSFPCGGWSVVSAEKERKGANKIIVIYLSVEIFISIRKYIFIVVVYGWIVGEEGGEGKPSSLLDGVSRGSISHE